MATQPEQAGRGNMPICVGSASPGHEAGRLRERVWGAVRLADGDAERVCPEAKAQACYLRESCPRRRRRVYRLRIGG